MSRTKTAAVLTVLASLCSGCAYWQNQMESLYKGQALVADNVYLLKDGATPNRQIYDSKTEYDGKWEELPTPCQGEPDKWTSKDKTDEIRTCAYAMKLLIDVRWAHFSDTLHGTVMYSNATLDTASLGLNAAGTITGAGTTQILSAIAGGLGSFKATLNQDILYKNSVELILLQMQTNRDKQANIIITKLGTPFQYNNMYEVAGDLYAYARAGSWTEALTSLQADTSAKKQACDNLLTFTKLNSDGTVASSTSDADTLAGKTAAQLAISNNQAATLDSCAAYKQNTKTTEKKDAVSETVKPVTIIFAKGSHTLTETDKKNIQNMASAFTKGDTISVTIHTDQSGSKSANETVSAARLKAIKEELKKQNTAIDTENNIKAEQKETTDRNATITLVKAAQ